MPVNKLRNGRSNKDLLPPACKRRGIKLAIKIIKDKNKKSSLLYPCNAFFINFLIKNIAKYTIETINKAYVKIPNRLIYPTLKNKIAKLTEGRYAFTELVGREIKFALSQGKYSGHLKKMSGIPKIKNTDQKIRIPINNLL